MVLYRGLFPHFFFGNLIQSGLLFYDQSPREVFSTFRKRFGDTFQFWLDSTRVIIVNKIGHIQDIFTNRCIYNQEKLDSLIYLDCVIKEVLCYSPPFTETYRTLTTDNYLPTSEAKLFKDDQIFITIYNLAIDTELWSIDPNQFYPKRFLD
ncbi:unnamed protein product [Rotaria sordida]|uniref:Uncharacterized protein n=1 Tax=Rotaria sordida TaxID=392033 RepID=A0A815DPN9_9BILA|nr:unnamed protein product [Rotaria sordida]CAF1574130.1 unnamed protein product [Rotaria sordida]